MRRLFHVSSTSSPSASSTPSASSPLSSRHSYRRFSLLLLCLLLVLLVGINLLMGQLERKNGWRVDCSFNAVTTQSQQTLDVLAALTHEVHIYALFQRGQEDAPLLELLNRYSAASPLVTWEQVDITENPGVIAKYTGATSDDTVVSDALIVACADTDRWRILSYSSFISQSYNYEEGVYKIAGLTYESAITSAISYVTQEVVPRAMILQGHGELDQSSANVFADLLVNNHYDVYFFTLSSAEANLSPEDLLVILSPVKDFSDSELKQLTDFAIAGGSILFTVDYSDPIASMPNFRTLLRYYGFSPLDGMVIASDQEPGTYFNDNRIYILPTVETNEITLSMVTDSTPTLLMTAARAFETPGESTDRSLTVTSLLSSGQKAYLHDVSDGSIAQLAEDATGPFTLGLLSHRITSVGAVSRAVVLGCSAMLTSDAIYAMTDTEEFLVRTVRYLSGDTSGTSDIIARSAIRPGLTAGSVTPGVAVVVALPLLVLAVAVIVLHRRKNL